MYCKTQIARRFSDAAQAYHLQAHLQREVANELLLLMPALSLCESVICDLGSGTGFVCESLLEMQPTTTIIPLDLAWGMVNHIKQKNNAAYCVCADADILPFQSQVIDVMTSSLMLQWSNNIEKTLTEIHRVLKKKSVFIFSTLGPRTLHELAVSWPGFASPVHEFISYAQLFSALESRFEVMQCVEKTYVMHYASVWEVMQSLKALGAVNSLQHRARGLMGRQRLQAVTQRYEQFRTAEGLMPATYQVFYGVVRK